MRLKNLYKILLAVVLATSACKAQVGSVPNIPKLTGIINVPRYTVAVLEWKTASGQIIAPILRKGETIEGYEVSKIDEELGFVTLQKPSTDTTLDVQLQPVKPLKGRTVWLRDAQLKNVLAAYQELSDCTVLRSENLTEAKFSLESAPNISRKEAAQLLESALTRQGFQVKRQGKFIFVIKPAEVPIVASFQVPEANAAGGPLIPPGMINFIEADLSQFLVMYSDMLDRTVIASPTLGVHKFSVRSQTSLSRPEVIQLMDSMLRLAVLPSFVKAQILSSWCLLRAQMRFPVWTHAPCQPKSKTPAHRPT
ncbi:MAG TPA: hypothetical protein VMZ27_13625 [Candidatus Saccharimonadales bacterium]|nr:hypothetical protein [Candidatus Saccharimonadales bacterium]